MDPKVKKRIKIYLIVGAVLLVVLLAVPWVILKFTTPTITKKNEQKKTTVVDKKVVDAPGYHVPSTKEELEAITKAIYEAIDYDGDVNYMSSDGNLFGTRLNLNKYNFAIFKTDKFNPIEENGKLVYRDYVEEGMWCDYDIVYSKDKKFALVNFGGDETVAEAFENY